MNALLRSVIAVTILVSGCNSAQKIHAETEATRGSNKAALRAGQADQGQIDQAALEALEAYVRHLVPVMWGRHAHSLAEIEVLVQLAQQDGRDGLVRAMARSPEFEQHWTPLLLDWLETPRMHSQQNASCYGRRLLPEVDASLAKFVRDNRPTDSEFGQRFTVRDVVISSLH